MSTELKIQYSYLLLYDRSSLFFQNTSVYPFKFSLLQFNLQISVYFFLFACLFDLFFFFCHFIVCHFQSYSFRLLLEVFKIVFRFIVGKREIQYFFWFYYVQLESNFVFLIFCCNKWSLIRQLCCRFSFSFVY